MWSECIETELAFTHPQLTRDTRSILYVDALMHTDARCMVASGIRKCNLTNLCPFKTSLNIRDRMFYFDFLVSIMLFFILKKF